ncbi:MAG: hypothetical protein KatS3mg126_2059 [Lysobacteraceae bacterium]|nr:MAG: hypothetical protein KatS3mg126_2059 [Xanthomonadaceae bacterium]
MPCVGRPRSRARGARWCWNGCWRPPGLVKGEQYLTQESFPAADGKRLRPDVVVLLPEGKHLIIDAKVSLTAYERYANAESEAARASHLKEHLASIRRHVEQLGERDYVGIEKLGSPDFVLMFVPVEAALVEAVRHDGQLYVHALERNVALVSPSTLLATLRTVSHLWRLERRSRNAETIAEHAGRLHDHFASLIDELEEIGQRLDRAKEVQVRAMRRLTEGGKGSILLQVQRLKELGAKAGKELPVALLDRAAADGGEAPSAAD